jgi:hypothetical protein
MAVSVTINPGTHLLGMEIGRFFVDERHEAERAVSLSSGESLGQSHLVNAVSNFDCHLVLLDLALGDVAALFDNFKPTHIPQILGGLGDGIGRCVGKGRG